MSIAVKGVVCNPGRKGSPEADCADILMLELPASRTGGKMSVVCAPQSVLFCYGISGRLGQHHSS